MTPRLIATLALGAVLCLPSGAHAAAASALIQGLTFQLIDLDPNDGLAPRLTWDLAIAGADVSSSFGSVFSFNPNGTWSVSFQNSSGDSVFDASTFTTPATASFRGALASIGGAGGGVGAQFQTGAGGSADIVSSFAYGAFTLSEMTELRILGSMSGAIHGDAGTGFAVPAGTPVDFSSIHAQSTVTASIQLNPLTGGSSAPVSESRSLSGENYTPSTNLGFPTAAYDDSFLLAAFALTMTNATTAIATGEFRADAYASGQQLVAPTVQGVPEPRTWALVATGLGLIGLRRGSGARGTWRQRLGLRRSG